MTRSVRLRAHRSSAPLVLLLGVAVLSVLLGWVVGSAAGGDTPIVALLTPVVLVPVVVWREPRVGLYVLMLGAVTIEQFGYDLGEGRGAVTASIPFFQGLLPGVGVTAAEMLLLLTLLVVVLRAVRDRVPVLWGSALAGLLAATTVLVLIYLGLGVLRGGDVRMALWEVRPFLYLVVAYFLARSLVTRPADARPLLWIIVLGSGLKAVYGIHLWISVRHLDPRPEAILAHEESFFFGLFLFTTAGLWLFGVRGRLRTIATLLLPVVLFADMANSRRTAWLILAGGLLLMVVVAAVRVPARRRTLGVLACVGALGTAVYLPLFWDSSGTIAQPARAVRSQIAPDERDELSNDYRAIENYNLLVRIGGTRSTGLGFGIPITYSGLVDLSDSNPLIRFVPHNTALWVWMRMGLAGMTVFALVLGVGALSSVRVTRAVPSADGMLVGALGAATLMGYAAMGAVDLGFFWFRNAIAMGIVLGVVDGIRHHSVVHRTSERSGVAALSTAPPVTRGFLQ